MGEDGTMDAQHSIAATGRDREVLETIKAEFPHLKVKYVFGYIALPADAAGQTAADLETLLGKLRGTLR